MKKVFNSHSEVCHIWASQSQSEGRANNIFFEKDTIYSYGHHFPMARIYSKGDKRVVLFTYHGYSPSTSKHKCRVNRAIPSHWITLYVDDVNNPKASLIEYAAMLGVKFLDEFNTISPPWDTPANTAKEFEKGVNEFNDACDFFELPKLKINFDEFHKGLLIEHYKIRLARKIALATPEMIQKREVESAKRKAAKEKAMAAKLEDQIKVWKSGGVAYGLESLSPQLIRIKDGEVETTRRARVPLEDALHMYKNILKGTAKQGDACGVYTFRSVQDGLITIGCHTFNLSDVKEVLEKHLQEVK